MKKLLALLLTLALLIPFAACGAPSAPTAPTASPPAADGAGKETGPTEPVKPTEPVPTDEAAGGDRMDFTTEAFDGSSVSLSDFSDAKLILVNFFEPWCGPCVGEMPDLETLYQEHRDEGLVILGVFYTPNMDDEVQAVLDRTGVTYPILRGNDALLSQTSQYVPTTFFMDGAGNIVGEQIIGSQSLAQWEKAVGELLK